MGAACGAGFDDPNWLLLWVLSTCMGKVVSLIGQRIISSVMAVVIAMYYFVTQLTLLSLVTSIYILHSALLALSIKP